MKWVNYALKKEIPRLRGDDKQKRNVTLSKAKSLVLLFPAHAFALSFPAPTGNLDARSGRA